MSSPVSELSCSRTCRAGFGDSLYARLSASNCLAVIVVRGRLLALSMSNSGNTEKAVAFFYQFYSLKMYTKQLLFQIEINNNLRFKHATCVQLK